MLDKDHLANFEGVRIQKEELESLREAKDKREQAQYSVTKRATKEIADQMKKQARDFVDRVEEILDQWK